jgi:LAO/AO transport system kinase
VTLLELGSEAAREELESVPARSAHRVGLTGPPGAGKSTLLGKLIDRALEVSRRPAVIAIDPTSPLTGGALLGDRIRMQDHTGESDVFIRSMAGRNLPGGTAPGLESVITAVSAAGFDPIFVETVGVGQSESAVRQIVDTLVLVVTPLQGDDVQALKAGVLEVADILCVNHSDRDGADRVKSLLEEIDHAGSFRDQPRPVVTTVATTGAGVDDLWAAIEGHRPRD